MQVIKGSINSKQHIDAVKRQHDKHVKDKQKNTEQNSTSNTYDDDLYDVDADLEAFSDTIDDMLDALDNRRCTNGYLRYEEDRQPKLVCRRTPHMLGEFGLDEDVPLTIGAWHLVRAIVDKDVVSDAHDVGIDVMRQLPLLFDDPLAAWRADDGTICLLLDDDTDDGSLLFCVVMGDALDGSNIIKTIYGVTRDRSGYGRPGKGMKVSTRLRHALLNGNVLYVDRLRLKMSLRAHGENVPNEIDDMPNKKVMVNGIGTESVTFTPKVSRKAKRAIARKKSKRTGIPVRGYDYEDDMFDLDDDVYRYANIRF